MRQRDWTVLMEDSDGLFTELVKGRSHREARRAAKLLYPAAKFRLATPNRISVYCGGTEWHEEGVC